MKKASLIVISLTLLLLSSITLPHAANAKAPSTVNARIMTYNIHAGIGSDGQYDRGRIAKEIKISRADIIALQEVDVHWGSRSNHENMIKELAEELNMFYFFAPIYDFDPLNTGEPRRQYGVAVLSKYPILKTENHSITRLSTQDPDPSPEPAPGFLEVLLNVKGAKLSFYVTHLDFRPDPSVRQMQVHDMLEIMSHSKGASILAGDMNAAPDAPELAPLFAQFQDAWDEIHTEHGFTFPAIAPNIRIDYLLASRQITVKQANVLSTLASDHLPVIADISLKKGKK